MKQYLDVLVADMLAIRQRRPLVFSMTNYVVMNETANALLAIGASPVMSDAIEEAAEMAAISSALVLNIGTLYPRTVESMIEAGRAANRKGIPVVLDPVGAGATTLRTDAARMILSKVDVTIVRANQGEAMAVAGLESKVRGVDSVDDIEEFTDTAMRIASMIECQVAVTGRTDVITDGTRTWLCDNGHPLLQAVTGTGCTATALVGAFLAVNDDALLAATGALALYGMCGELAAQGAHGPGSFEIALRDCLWSVSEEQVRAGVKVRRP